MGVPTYIFMGTPEGAYKVFLDSFQQESLLNLVYAVQMFHRKSTISKKDNFHFLPRNTYSMMNLNIRVTCLYTIPSFPLENRKPENRVFFP